MKSKYGRTVNFPIPFVESPLAGRVDRNQRLQLSCIPVEMFVKDDVIVEKYVCDSLRVGHDAVIGLMHSSFIKDHRRPNCVHH